MEEEGGGLWGKGEYFLCFRPLKRLRQEAAVIDRRQAIYRLPVVSGSHPHVRLAPYRGHSCGRCRRGGGWETSGPLLDTTPPLPPLKEDKAYKGIVILYSLVTGLKPPQ